MNIKQEGPLATIFMEGAIGESTSLFTWNIPHTTRELILDMSKITTINSIGVKKWIMWTVRIPADWKVKIVNAPFVIASQASLVFGFVKGNMTLESVQVPYVCEACGIGHVILMKRGVEYEYRTATTPKWVRLPKNKTCPKCGEAKFEPDLIEEKTFGFLK